jgi:hypothetical protein
MEHGRHATAPSILAPHLCRGANGTIRRREGTGKEMGKKQPQQSLARRNSDDANGGGRHGHSSASENIGQHSDAKPAEQTTDTIEVSAAAGRVVEGAEEVKPKRYSPPACVMCTAVRPANTNYTEVYHTRKEYGYTVRYCRCKFCRDTFKDAVKE